jgi:hypothetical protein
MKRAIICLFGFLVFPSSAYALSCNQWYATMDSFISESKQINGVLKSIKDDVPATCTYSRETRIPIMQRNLKVIRSFYGCEGQTGLAAQSTGASLKRLLKKVRIDTNFKCADVGM